MFAANSDGGTEISFCSCGVSAAVLRLLLVKVGSGCFFLAWEKKM